MSTAIDVQGLILTEGYDTNTILTFNGAIVGFVKEAKVASKENGGYIVVRGNVTFWENLEGDGTFHHTSATNTAEPWTRFEGDVDFVGFADERIEVLMQRLEEIRAQRQR